MSTLKYYRLFSTYNVLEACRKLRITNVILASSETLIGIPFDPHPPQWLPITEEYGVLSSSCEHLLSIYLLLCRNERRPESAYSLSKLMLETMAEQYCRWDPSAKILSYRFSNVMLPEEYAGFEDWQKDPKARYWNCWGEHSIPFSDVSNNKYLYLLFFRLHRCSRWCTSSSARSQIEDDRSPSVPYC
jgi:nucleoside-diphosphate-sugar epimerase